MSAEVRSGVWGRRFAPWLTWAEWTYAVVLVGALTQGPVVSLWNRQTQSGILASPTLAVEVTLLAVQMPAIALLARRLRPRLLSTRPVVALALFAGLALLSTLWSTYRIHTFVNAIALVTTLVAGCYLAVTFAGVRFPSLVLIAMQPGLLASEWAVRRGWPGAKDQLGRRWTGIYYNRNSLSPPAVVGAVTAACIVVWLLRRGPTWRGRILAVGVALVGAFDLRLHLLARSATQTAAAAAFVAIASTLGLARVIARRSPASARLVPPVYALLVPLALLAALGLVRNLGGIDGRQAGFDGRTIYWSQSWRGIKVHPLRGWGWMAAWRTTSFRVGLPAVLSTEYWAHSSYFDVILGLGAVGALLFCVVIYVTLANSARSGLGADAIELYRPALAALVLTASTQESFLVGGHFFFLLLVACCVAVPFGRVVAPSGNPAGVGANRQPGVSAMPGPV